MKFNTTFLALFVMTILGLLTSCDKDEPLEHLPGTWTLESVEVNGQSGTGVGTMTFNEDLTGSMALSFTGGGIQATQGGSFTYEATNDEIIFNDGTVDEFTWNRNVDKSNEQEFEFVENVSGTNYTVVLNFTK